MQAVTAERLYCSVADCERPVAGHGREVCSSHLKQLQRNGTTAPIAEKLTPEERAIEAINLMKEIRPNAPARPGLGGKFETAGAELADAEDDREYQAARREFFRAGRALFQPTKKEIKRPPGRPPQVDPIELARLLKKFAGAPNPITRAAGELGVHRMTIWRYVTKRR